MGVLNRVEKVVGGDEDGERRLREEDGGGREEPVSFDKVRSVAPASLKERETALQTWVLVRMMLHGLGSK